MLRQFIQLNKKIGVSVVMEQKIAIYFHLILCKFKERFITVFKMVFASLFLVIKILQYIILIINI